MARASKAKEAELRAAMEAKLATLTGKAPEARAEAKEEVIDVVTPGAERAPPATFEEAYAMVKEAVLGEAEADIKPHLEIGLTRMKDTPPLKSISAVVEREVSLEEVREWLFMPDEKAMKMYPKLIRGAANAVASNSEQPAEVKAATPFLSMLFLYHTHHWAPAQAFVQTGGLLVLPDLLACDNLYLRGQSMEIFQNLTNDELYDWFKTPSEAGWEELPTLSLHRQMLGLMRTKLIDNLVLNSKSLS